MRAFFLGRGMARLILTVRENGSIFEIVIPARSHEEQHIRQILKHQRPSLEVLDVREEKKNKKKP
jgi:hypothetical protein